MDVPDLDEAARPRAARGLTLTPAQRAPSEHLRAIHDAFRADLRELQARVADVREGTATLGDVRAAVNKLTLERTQETLGSFCGRYCQFLTLHHMIEDRAMLPKVARHPDYAAVADKLAAEHVVIHAHLTRIDAIVVRLTADPGAFVELDDAVGALATAVLSHFAYEEEELAEPMGLLRMQV